MRRDDALVMGALTTKATTRSAPAADAAPPRPGAGPRARISGAWLGVATAAFLATALVAALALGAPDLTDRFYISGWGQALVEAAACVACALAARAMRGRPRLVWTLFAV